MNNILQLGKSCCGCSGCEPICPKKCITIQPDSEGFLCPVVDESKCVDCGLCVKHCPIMTDAKRCDEPKVYAAKYKDHTSAFKSTSGGLFIPLAGFWGIQKFHPDFYDDNGVSLVLVNTEKDKDYFDLIKDRPEIIESDYEKASAMNSNLVVASERPACRDTIYDGFDDLDFDSYVKTKLAFKVNPKTKIKKMIPLGVKRKKLH